VKDVVTADRRNRLRPGPAAAWTVRGAFGGLRLIAALERRKSS